MSKTAKPAKHLVKVYNMKKNEKLKAENWKHLTNRDKKFKVILPATYNSENWT